MGGHTERQFKELDSSIKGFLNFYSTTDVAEDSADIFAYCMTDADKLGNEKDVILQKKFAVMKKFCEKFSKNASFNDSYWEMIVKCREEKLLQNNWY